LSVQKQLKKAETKLKKIEELIKTAEECYTLYTKIRNVLGRFGILQPHTSRMDIMSIALMISGKGKVRKKKVMDSELYDELRVCLDAIDTLNEIYNRMHKGGYSELFEMMTAMRQEEIEEEEELTEEEVSKLIDKFKQKRRLSLG